MQTQSGSMRDVIIVGGGAAAWSAALYAVRRAMDTLVITKDIGGQAMLTQHIENYPGINSIVTGPDLMSTFWEQAKKFGAKTHIDEVVQIEARREHDDHEASSSRMRGSSNNKGGVDPHVHENDGVEMFHVTTRTGAAYTARAIILAFGLTPRNMGVPGEEALTGRGVHYCATCDAPLYKNKNVAVVGGTNAAMDAALLLAKTNERVFLLYHKVRLAGNENMRAQVRAAKNIEHIVTTALREVRGDKHVEALAITTPDGEKDLVVDGVFVEMGYHAKTDFVRDVVTLNKKNEIVVDAVCNTSHAGIFAAGDITSTPYKQIVISAGEGATAALEAYQYVQRRKGNERFVTIDWE
jgi:thioredoxin reductase (NADPH)